MKDSVPSHSFLDQVEQQVGLLSRRIGDFVVHFKSKPSKTEGGMSTPNQATRGETWVGVPVQEDLKIPQRKTKIQTRMLERPEIAYREVNMRREKKVDRSVYKHIPGPQRTRCVSTPATGSRK